MYTFIDVFIVDWFVLSLQEDQFGRSPTSAEIEYARTHAYVGLEKKTLRDERRSEYSKGKKKQVSEKDSAEAFLDTLNSNTSGSQEGTHTTSSGAECSDDGSSSNATENE